MPRYAHFQLRWSEQTQGYVLSTDNQESHQPFTNEWLEQSASFSFHSRSGMHYTVRKQRVQRGGSYWYGYRRLHGRIVKRYIGSTANLTLARLEEVACLLTSESTYSQPAPQAISPKDSSHAEALPLLLSKLSPPRLHTLLLDRERLFAQLDAGREGRLTLLSAPAGFGKTTLVCQWIAARRVNPNFPSVAWVSLETSDNDPVRFWRYLITACQAFPIDLAQAHNALLETTPQPPFLPSSLETVLTTLLNALAQCPASGILVLEDYHAITSPQIHETLAFFLEHLPANLHLIMLTRSAPPFSLTRLRARNDLAEIRIDELRFTQEETAFLLQQAFSFPLTTETAHRLHAQLEGWGAGLHLAKLALQRTVASVDSSTYLPPEAQQALTLFSSSNPSFSFQEYFVGEVLVLQPEPVQQFLLQTSILTYLTSSLCDAVAEQHNSQEMLLLLERANLFLEPLDISSLPGSSEARQWYRYHALFSAAMRQEASLRIGEGHVRALSVRASRWYETHGMLSAAIDAALYAQDYERAALLLERSTELQTAQNEVHEYHTLHRWLEQIPETVLQQHPVLCLSYATTQLFLSPSWEPGPPTIQALERLLQMAEHCFHSQNNLPKLGELFAFRSLLAWRQNERQVAAMYAGRALTWLSERQPLWRGISLSIAGLGLSDAGELQHARTLLLEANEFCKIAKNRFFQQISTISLARIFYDQGELQRASTYYHQALAEEKEHEPTRSRCYIQLGLAAIAYEWNELDNAEQLAQEIVSLSQLHPHLTSHEVPATDMLARIQLAQGRIAIAQQFATLLTRQSALTSRPSEEIKIARARLALATGDHMAMQRRVADLPQDDLVSQETEELLLIARWLRTQGRQEEALRLLEQQLVTAQKAMHIRHILEIQVEIALIYVACKQRVEAQRLLLEVLATAFGGNYVRLFLDAGEDMAAILRSLLAQVHDQPLLAYIRTLLNAFPVQQQRPTSPLLEPLSAQETRVLRLLVQHRSNADIANELVVSVNTVRTQVQSIYRKLDVHTRSAAGEVARELHLI